MTYSTDIRELVLKKHSEGSSIRKLAKEFEMSPQTIQLWKKDLDTKAYKRKPSKIDDERLREDVEEYPDAYQHERAARFNCSQRAIGKALKRIGITQKKESKPSQIRPRKTV